MPGRQAAAVKPNFLLGLPLINQFRLWVITVIIWEGIFCVMHKASKLTYFSKSPLVVCGLTLPKECM